MVTLFDNPISTEAPGSIYARVHHHQPPVGCDASGPIQTNNAFNNLLLDNQTWPVWPLPYLLWVVKDGTENGVAFNHTERNQVVFGPDPNKTPVQYYFYPTMIRLFMITGEHWDTASVRTVLIDKLSATIKLTANNGSITMPLVQGMGFVTAVCQKTRPVIQSAVGIQEFHKVGYVNNNQTAKYYVRLFNQIVWSLYVTEDPQNDFFLADPHHLVASQWTVEAVVQFAKGEGEPFDAAAGCYPTSIRITGSVDGSKKSGTYGLEYNATGHSYSGSTLVYTLPHLDVDLIGLIRDKDAHVSLDSATKGLMKGYLTNKLVMEVNNLPTDVGFEPWTSVNGFHYSPEHFTGNVKDLIRHVARQESLQDVEGLSDLDSMYFAGKQLDKFAYIAYVAHFLLRDSDVTSIILPKIKRAIERFAANHQKHPLVYDETWKGIISSAAPDQDFGNSNYNDHHFHFGYHIHAIALVAKVDPGWLDENNRLVRNFATSLIRDYANPSTNDPYFPQYRCFDWYSGHSWAHGIFPSGDGKNEESSSEDYHSIHALKLYGEVTGDQEMEMGAALILGIMRNLLNKYMLFSSDNKQEPPEIIGNKVSGILFENKIDFATFFGRGSVADEWIHGIHMIPITSISSYIRGPKFVREEWEEKLAAYVDRIPDGWQGILKLNAGLFDPRYSWKWFSRDDWNDHLIDGGMSRTWSLAYLAGIGGAT